MRGNDGSSVRKKALVWGRLWELEEAGTGSALKPSEGEQRGCQLGPGQGGWCQTLAPSGRMLSPSRPRPSHPWL